MKKLAFILALGFISNSFSQKELFISSSIIKKFNEPRSQLNVVLANGVNTFTHQIDIHVTQVLINKVTLEVNSQYSFDLDNNTLNFKRLSDGTDINSDIISKSEKNGVITIVIDDESEVIKHYEKPVKPAIDSVRLKADLKSGQAVYGAHLEDSKRGLMIK
mgnify:CR=1 FL=1